MPIEIKITDINKLKPNDIINLHNYLLSNISCDLPLNNVEATWEEPTPCEITKGTLGETTLPLITPKKTKKTKGTLLVAELKNEDKLKEEWAMRELKKAPFTLTMSDGKDHTFITQYENDIDYDGLISFVLEATREKRLEFDKVMEIVERFQIPNLNSLDKYPHLIVPVYIAIKEILKP
jgi:hypothetical protein